MIVEVSYKKRIFFFEYFDFKKLINSETRKTTKGWKVVREKLVTPKVPTSVPSVESINSSTSRAEIALPKSNPLITGKARGWKVLRKRIERRQFTEDLRQSNLQLNKMDETVTSLR